MNLMFLRRGYNLTFGPPEDVENGTYAEPLQEWIDLVHDQGNDNLPNWILAPKFIGICAPKQRVLDELYDRHEEVFYELDLMQLRRLNYAEKSINYIVYRKKTQ
jgi:hypothetical protein